MSLEGESDIGPGGSRHGVNTVCRAGEDVPGGRTAYFFPRAQERTPLPLSFAGILTVPVLRPRDGCLDPQWQGIGAMQGNVGYGLADAWLAPGSPKAEAVS